MTWLRSFLLNKSLKVLWTMLPAFHTAVIFPLILTSICEKSQSHQKYQSAIRIHLSTPLAKENFPSGFPMTTTWKKKERSKVWRRNWFKMCLYIKNMLCGTLCSASLQVHLSHVYKGGTDQTSACTPHSLGVSSLHTSPAQSLKQMSFDCTSSAAAQCNCLLSSHFFMQVKKSPSSCPHPCRNAHAFCSSYKCPHRYAGPRAKYPRHG